MALSKPQASLNEKGTLPGNFSFPIPIVPGTLAEKPVEHFSCYSDTDIRMKLTGKWRNRLGENPNVIWWTQVCHGELQFK